MASSALFLNFYTTTLAASLTSTATTMSVSSTTGLPSSLSSGQFIPMVLNPASAPGTVYEIVYVTGISGSSLTISRGEEGTAAQNWNASDIVFSTNTADTTGSQEGGTFANPTLTGSVTIPNATANNNPVALGQFGSSPLYTSSSVSSATTLSVSLSFTAPSDCTILVLGLGGMNVGITTMSMSATNATLLSNTNHNTSSSYVGVGNGVATASAGASVTLTITFNAGSASAGFGSLIALIIPS